MEEYIVDEVSARTAGELVRKYHYSGTVVNNSRLHLGIHCPEGEILGALQYGPPMNGKKTACKLSPFENMFELNRMVMNDSEPRNSESRAISLCNKWLRKNTDIQWLLSSSDGKEGNVGYIYQATNWKYLGYRVSDSFYELDGDTVHSVTVWHRYKEKNPDRYIKTTNQILCDNFDNVSVIKSKQHIYVMPLYKNVKFNFPEQEYPKKDTEPLLLERKWIRRDGIPDNTVEKYAEFGKGI